MPYAKMIDNIEKKAEGNSVRKECDYIGEDGLLVCGKCHTPKQVRIQILGVEKTPYALCKCEGEKRDRENEMRRNAKLINELREKAFPACKGSRNTERDMRTWTFENDKGYQPKLIKQAKNYVLNFEKFEKEGKGLLLYGNAGVGKSYTSACIANALIDKCIPVIMTDFATIANEVQSTFAKDEYYRNLNNCALLILDDLVAERDTEYMKEIVHHVINSRINIGLPMIITSNLTNEELKNPASMKDKRLFSRLFKACYPIQVKGDDLRKKQMVESHPEMKQLLNG